MDKNVFPLFCWSTFDVIANFADLEKDVHDCRSFLTSLSVHDTTLTTEADGVNRLPYLLQDRSDKLLSWT